MWSPICINTAGNCALKLDADVENEGLVQVQESSEQQNTLDGIIETAEEQATPEMKHIVRNMLDVKNGKKTIEDVYKEYNPIQAAIEERKATKQKQEKEAQLVKQQDEIKLTLEILKLVKSANFIKKLTKVFGTYDTNTVRIEFTKQGSKVKLLVVPCKVTYSEDTVDLIPATGARWVNGSFTRTPLCEDENNVPLTDAQHDTIEKAISVIVKPFGLYCMPRDKACKKSFIVAEMEVLEYLKKEGFKNKVECCGGLLLLALLAFVFYLLLH